MTRNRPCNFVLFGLKTATVLGVSVTLLGCSVAEPLSVQTIVSSPSSQIARIALNAPDSLAGAPVRTMADALGRSFESQGMEITSEGTLLADYALAITPATIGVQQAPPSEDTQEEIWISPARESRRFDECEAMELRGTLLLINRESGEVAFRGQARTIDCGFNDAAIADLAEGLVEEFVAQSQSLLPASSQ